MSTTFRVVTAPPHDSTPTDATSNNVQEAYIALDGQSGAESSSDELADDERLGPLGDFSDSRSPLSKALAQANRSSFQSLYTSQSRKPSILEY